MRFLLYKDLDTRSVKASFAKVRAFIEAGDFRSAEIKKLNPSSYWRAKLDYTNRLLLQFATYGQETVCLALEVIENHAYEKSRFLRGAQIDEAKIEREPMVANPPEQGNASIPGALPMRWIDPKRNEFDLLDKPIIYDDAQEAVRRLPPPVVIVGSAGSGKTAVTLTKLRDARGSVLYVTQSAYLAQSARAIYDSFDYDNPNQEVEFLSFLEFVETLRVPAGREVTFAAFSAWFDRHRQSLRATLGDLDAHAIYEEFRGVISANAKGPLDEQTYLELGPRQSMLAPEARQAAHALFGRYCQWLKDSAQFDLNLVAHEWASLAKPTYDFVVIDEVQDLTNVQLSLILSCLSRSGMFLLCGDSNQIVHPNFFSWAAVRSLFWQGLAGEGAERQDLSVLRANFRNTRAVTELANTLLKIKQARFGSIDRESNFLIESTSLIEGQVRLVQDKDAVLRELDARSKGSVRHAVIVLRDEDKRSARDHFHTPLVFSVHEAKGLEYPHVILYGLVSSQRANYEQICEGVTPADLQVDQLAYRRAHDKTDKSLEIYKFYVNALYVAMTRAVETLTLVESDTAHPILGLLGLDLSATTAAAPVQNSTRDEWAQEARKLELQGKQEQAQAIRETFLQVKAVPWKPWSQQLIEEFLPRALNRDEPSNKPRQALFDYALWHGQSDWIHRLSLKTRFDPAHRLYPVDQQSWLMPIMRGNRSMAIHAIEVQRDRYLQAYGARNFKDILRQCDQYGVDHQCPTGASSLMMAARAGNIALVDALLERGADPLLTDEFGHTPWLFALNRAVEDDKFMEQCVGPLAERIAPQAFDVQTDDRLIRLSRHQGEYWILCMMMAGFKVLFSHWINNDHETLKSQSGFFAEFFQDKLSRLPHNQWKEKRHKRTYINAVLARAEENSNYQPARRLWVRTGNGFYMPNPGMQVRTKNKSGVLDWYPVYEVLNINWVKEGNLGSLDRINALDFIQSMMNAGTRAKEAMVEQNGTSVP